MATTVSHSSRTTSTLVIVLFFSIISWVYAKDQKTAPLVIASIAELSSLIEEVPISGSVISPQIAELAMEVNGIVTSLAVDIGDRVRSGDELLRLDTELHTLSLAGSRAASKQAREQLDDAKRRLTSFEALAKQHTVSDNELQSLAAQVRIDSAALEGFIAQQKRQEALLRRHTLNAPFAGIISQKHVAEGEWVQPGESVFSLIATNDLRLDFQVPQTVFGKLAQVTNVAVTLDAFPRQVFHGRVDTVVPVTNSSSRTFLVRIALNDKQVNITPGMSATAVLRLNSGNQGVVISRDALLRSPDGSVTVWVVKQQNNESIVAEHKVQTGLSFNGKITIIDGLKAGDQVVIEGNEGLRDGQAVTVKSLQ